jgi:hypothetical protein
MFTVKLACLDERCQAVGDPAKNYQKGHCGPNAIVLLRIIA